ncbi:aldehyde dehydrogenase (NAD+) [Nocardia tenerifensis]|uniref:Aldehyde dehydrogenase (NAD+) n=1 Tax=Nocardia tenerifensis TaxID=228006 RepID=A0A318JW23_9NOCA|nr:phosphonoacetaldehyde dehydrogenase [Nocardia tenerifensis]PXX58142.1 aldehyde dehydrogenase (NAD+) [Nocardia tenerifensis]
MSQEVSAVREDGPRIGGKRLLCESSIDVRYPHTGEVIGTVGRASAADVGQALDFAEGFRCSLSRYERHRILVRARELIEAHADEWARLITLESGLCLRDTSHEVRRTCDVLQCAANQVLVEHGGVYPADVTRSGGARKIFTVTEPLLGVVCAITPFNHPLNQVAHKVVPAVASGNRVVLKPSEKTPLSALKFADTLYEAGLPPEMLQVVTGDPAELVGALLDDPRVSMVAFTGSSTIGKRIADRSGYRRIILELGGIDPAIVCDDTDLAAAAELVARGAYGNSGQRCTAIKRVLVQDAVAEEFTELLVEQTRRWRSGDPLDPATDIGTVIDEAAAKHIEDAVAAGTYEGAEIACGGIRSGAHYTPTVVAGVTPGMALVTDEVFGPVAPIVRFADDADAIRIANSSRYALSASVLTRNLNRAFDFVTGLHAGNVNIAEVPGYRLESMPFGGLKDSGLGDKEGVVEAMRNYTTVKTCSLPW